MGFVGSTSDYLVGNDAGSCIRGSKSKEEYRPAWNRRGSL